MPAFCVLGAIHEIRPFAYCFVAYRVVGRASGRIAAFCAGSGFLMGYPTALQLGV
jgi:hypothetical protein